MCFACEVYPVLHSACLSACHTQFQKPDRSSETNETKIPVFMVFTLYYWEHRFKK